MAIINPASITERQILADLEAWLESRPDGEGWDSAFSGSNGRTLLELIAGSGSFLSYQARTSRREANAMTAKLLSSVLAIAFTFGYPVNRRRAARLQVTVTNTRTAGDPLGDTVNLSRVPELGHAGTPPRPVSILETGLTDLKPGESTVLICAVGSWVTVSPDPSASADFAEISINPPAGRSVMDIDNAAVTLTDVSDSANVPLTRYLELIDDSPPSVLVKTHPTSLVFLFGTRSGDGSDFGVRAEGRMFKVEYLLLPPQLGSDLDVFGVFAPDQGGPWRGLRVDDVRPVAGQPELPADDLQKIGRVVPGYFAAKRRMVTPSDHQAIILSHGGILDAALESGTCTSSEGEPLAEESIFSQDQCSAAGGVWRTRSLSVGCVSVVSYIRASTERPGEPLRYADGDDIPVGSSIGDPQRLGDNGELALEAYLREFQTLGAEVVFRTGVPVPVQVSLAYRTGTTSATDAGLADEQLLDFTEHVHAAIKRQCYRLGGVFDISRLQRDIEAHDLIYTIILHTPRNNLQLSWVGFFDYREDDLDIQPYSESNLADQGTDTVSGSGYLLPTRALDAELTFSSVGQADPGEAAADAGGAYAIPNRDDDHDDQVQLGYDINRPVRIAVDSRAG